MPRMSYGFLLREEIMENSQVLNNNSDFVLNGCDDDNKPLIILISFKIIH
jgi:hypothetical protein